jgi:hypothetical protein
MSLRAGRMRRRHLNDKSRLSCSWVAKRADACRFAPLHRMKLLLPILLLAAVSARAADSKAKADEKPSPIGYSDTPVIPGTQWKVHDIDRPRPVAVAPGKENAAAPSDAIVIFDGTSSDALQAKEKDAKGKETGKIIPAHGRSTAACS